MIKEFRDFIARGSVLELAVAVIIGAAFGAIVNSLVEDLVNPIIGIIFGKPDFSSIYINLSGQEYATYAAAKEAADVVELRPGLGEHHVADGPVGRDAPERGSRRSASASGSASFHTRLPSSDQRSTASAVASSCPGRPTAVRASTCAWP